MGALLHEGLKVTKSSEIIEKQYPNSFFKTNLQTILESFGVDQVIVTGMMTHMCIDSTTRVSKELGYNPILISDATATKNLVFQEYEVSAHEVQASFLSALQNFSEVITTEDYLEREKRCIN